MNYNYNWQIMFPTIQWFLQYLQINLHLNSLYNCRIVRFMVVVGLITSGRYHKPIQDMKTIVGVWTGLLCCPGIFLKLLLSLCEFSRCLISSYMKDIKHKSFNIKSSDHVFHQLAFEIWHSKWCSFYGYLLIVVMINSSEVRQQWLLSNFSYCFLLFNNLKY